MQGHAGACYIERLRLDAVRARWNRTVHTSASLAAAERLHTLKAPADLGDDSALPSLLSPTNGTRPKPWLQLHTLSQIKEAMMLRQRCSFGFSLLCFEGCPSWRRAFGFVEIPECPGLVPAT